MTTVKFGVLREEFARLLTARRAAECTHGGDCPVHPVSGVHDFDLLDEATQGAVLKLLDQAGGNLARCPASEHVPVADRRECAACGRLIA